MIGEPCVHMCWPWGVDPRPLVATLRQCDAGDQVSAIDVFPEEYKAGFR